MAISLRLSEEDTLLIKSYADLHNISISELFRQSVLDRIQDEYDLSVYEKAKADFNKDPKTYSLDEVKKELGLD